ncbi:flagellar biosynthesis protein FlhF [Desulfobotulus alkaliphilus]|uniref:Flagellar biosynthesis protein FlhF n=1 Tax=Desulfobotulus alkaliphilus TaxID=622671 RepID=A0A562RVF6_9BACT|nr:flagellar biosynthesis protein FlhF [Desulfobotulus alkaliphilus]TWI72400.1 flagellar biosynthesis protein FlhF [Desulfobotulus alkaliphilus]
MSVKTFRAPSIQEALAQVKSELGVNAVILSTRKSPIDPRNPYGSGGFEVTAAAEEQKKPLVRKEAPVRNLRLRTGVSPLKASGKIPERKFSVKGEDAEEDVAAVLDRVPEDFSSGASATGVGWQQVQHELVSIRDMLFLLQQGEHIPDFITRHPESLSLYTRLVRTGLTEKRARQLMETSAQAAGAGKEALSRRVFVEMMALIEGMQPFESLTGQRCVVAFAGPTGVGKTTTIAKLAADLSLKQKKRVGLISVDSYRIGALEQLKTYAGIMGIPCLPAFNREDLQTALRQMQNREVILIDTAGLSHLDHARMEELAGLLGGRQAIATHLVLSAATGRENMREAAENFSQLSPRSYVFTKLDETRKRGGILDQLADYPLPVSYVTDGQRVPEDIHPVTRKGLLQRIFETSGTP